MSEAGKTFQKCRCYFQTSNLRLLTSFFVFSFYAPFVKDFLYRFACQFPRFITVGYVEYSCHEDIDRRNDHYCYAVLIGLIIGGDHVCTVVPGGDGLGPEAGKII